MASSRHGFRFNNVSSAGSVRRQAKRPSRFARNFECDDDATVCASLFLGYSGWMRDLAVGVHRSNDILRFLDGNELNCILSRYFCHGASVSTWIVRYDG